MLHPVISRVCRLIRRKPILALLSIPLAVCTYLTSSYIYWEHDNLYYDLLGTSYAKYTWPLNIDTDQVLKDYRSNQLKIKPIPVINHTYYKVPASRYCDMTKPDKVLVTVLIKTRVTDRYNRDMLRRTWIEDLLKNDLQYSFLVGQCSSAQCEDNLKAELVDHDDMVHGDFIDHYYNNTLKFSMALKYISDHCTNARYVLIIDGDYSLNVKSLLKYLEDLKYPTDLYAGRLWESSRPGRETDHPQYMSYKLYPYRRLPPFIAAGASLISTEMIQKLEIIAKFTKYLPFDDVFYGMVAKKLNIALTDATELLPSWFIPKVDDIEAHHRIIGSHRFGNLTEVEMIHDALHS